MFTTGKKFIRDSEVATETSGRHVEARQTLEGPTGVFHVDAISRASWNPLLYVLY